MTITIATKRRTIRLSVDKPAPAKVPAPSGGNYPMRVGVGFIPPNPWHETPRRPREAR